MTIFNSLGSNYDFWYVVQTLLPMRDPKARLCELLEKRYNGQATLFYKGRHAITAALELAELPADSVVLINGYTCLAVWQAVKAARLEPILVDPPKTSLDFTATELQDAILKNPKARAVVYQHTLGYVQNIQDIKELCRQHDIVLIEDLAHSTGARYLDGDEVGTHGDFTVLSFSQDKIIDAVSGGALIDRRSRINEVQTLTGSPTTVSLGQQLRDRIYPGATWIVRRTYGSGFGKLLHKIFNHTRVFASPMALTMDEPYYQLPAWHAKLAVRQIAKLESQIAQRRIKAKQYLSALPKENIPSYVAKTIDNSTCLRFPLLSDEVTRTLRSFAKRGFHLTDRWFDAPIAPKKYAHLSQYTKGSCPHSEIFSARMLNLPTHQNMSSRSISTLTKELSV